MNPATAFQALVNWFHDEMIVREHAPGFMVGLSGTDSLVTFLAAATASELAGRPERIMGVHFAPSEDFLYDHPEAESHLWFRDEVLPWLHQQVPSAKIVVDTSIDWRCDGLRWGYLMDLSVVSNDKRRMMRMPEDQYWVVGTRNRTEDMLHNYSNTSLAASCQPIIHLWKSEVLEISEYLGVPKIALDKSCETDCICGRMALAANHIKEVDMLLQDRNANVESELRSHLLKFIGAQIGKNSFKKNIPYTPDSLVFAFETGSLNLKEFNHRKHLYVAWYYLTSLPTNAAFDRYALHLRTLLDSAGYSHRFNLEITRKYFDLIIDAMKAHPGCNFDELMEKSGILKIKITA